MTLQALFGNADGSLQHNFFESIKGSNEHVRLLARCLAVTFNQLG